MNRQVFGVFLGIIGITFVIYTAYTAQANSLEKITSTTSEETYHHDLKVSGALHYLDQGDEFGSMNESVYSSFDNCRPDEIGLYSDLGASVNVEPFFDGAGESCGDMKNYILVPVLKNESNSESFSNLEVGETR